MWSLPTGKRLQSTLADMKATLARHVDEIKELYSESDDTFDEISSEAGAGSWR